MFESYLNWFTNLQPSCLNLFVIEILAVLMDLQSTAHLFELIYDLQTSCLNWYRVSCPAIWIYLQYAATSGMCLETTHTLHSLPLTSATNQSQTFPLVAHTSIDVTILTIILLFYLKIQLFIYIELLIFIAFFFLILYRVHINYHGK
jgi:hypothetical protein